VIYKIMNLSDLRVFKAVVECGGVTKAAARVHRVQSNLTARIQHLEQDLGRQLFDRAGRRMVLTPEGRRLYASADRLLTLADEVKREMAGEGISGVVRIGAMESTAATRLPALLAEFHARHGGAQLELTTGTARALTDRLLAGEIDIAFAAGEVAHEALTAVAVFNEELVLVLPPGEATMDMAAASMVSFTTGCAYRRVAEGWFREQGGQLRRVVELGSYHAILACVAAGVGCAIVPRALLEIYPQRDLLRTLPLPRSYAAQPTWMVTRKFSPSPSVAAFRDLVLARTAAVKSRRRAKNGEVGLAA
jgi:DNA-binding transcriptional LysR family regulator